MTIIITVTTKVRETSSSLPLCRIFRDIVSYLCCYCYNNSNNNRNNNNNNNNDYSK